MPVEPPEEKSPVVTEIVLTDFAAVLVRDPQSLAGIDQLWLTKHGILGDEPTLGSAFSAEFVTVQTAQFQLLLLPDRVQLSVPMYHSDEAAGLIKRTLTNYVAALPGVTFRALGFNFSALLPNEGIADLRQWSREQFCPPKLVGSPFVADIMPMFGCFFTFRTFGFQVQAHAAAKKFNPAEGIQDTSKLPVQPGTSTMFLTINFQRDLTDQDDISEYVSRWPEALKLTRQIADLLS